jgi:iron complex outermembrane recepter protein
MVNVVVRLAVSPLFSLWLMAAAWAVPLPLFAQPALATLTGVVSDPSGAPVQGVALSLVDAGRSVRRRTSSDDVGAFTFAVPPGEYVLSASGAGFAPLQIEGVVLAAGDRRAVPVSLALAPVSEALTVRGAPPVTQGSSGTKTDTAILETPRSMSVITADHIQALQVVNIDEVLRYSAGVGTEFRGIDRARTDISMRGFNWSGFVFTDGMRGGVGLYGEFDVDPFGLERVEVLRGPASILYGASSPGGIVNVVSKRPTDTFHARVEAHVGSFEQVGTKVDIGGPLNADKTLLFRLTGVGRTGNSQVDTVEDSRLFVAPALTWTLAPRTSITFRASYQRDDAPWAIFLPAEGTVLPNPNGRIPSSRHLGEEHFVDRFHRWFFTPGYAFEHRGSRWTLQHGLRFGRYEFDALSVSGGELHEDARTVSRYPWVGDEHGHQLVTDSNAQTSTRLGRTTHRLLFGLDAKRSVASGSYGYDEGPPLDIFAPVYGATLSRDVPLYQSDRQTSSQVGFYAQDQVRAGKLVLNVGGRYDRAGSRTDDALSMSVTDQHDDAFTGQAGALYLFASGLAPFANYAESFEPQGGSDAQGRPFVPTTGMQIEGGLKYQLARTDSLVTVSGFVIRQQNVLTSDPLDARFSVQTGEVRSRGVDIDARVRVTGGTALMAAYTFTDAEVTKSNGADLGLRPAQTPRSLFSVWADHTVTRSRVQGLRLTGGIRWRGRTLDYENVITVPDVTLVDAGISYELRGTLSGVGLSVNASNLFDRTYVASCEGAYWCMYGPRRQLTATISRRW